MAGTLVMKFGGTSVGNAQAMAQAVEIVRQARSEWPRLVVVTSALSGVTNLLLDSAKRAVQGDLVGVHLASARLLSMHQGIADVLLTDPRLQTQAMQAVANLVEEFRNLCQAIGVLGEATPRALDAVAGLGERMSVHLLAASIEAAGLSAQTVEATRLIVTDDQFQSAHPDFEATTRRTRAELEPLLANGTVAVVTGFIAATPQGTLTTLGRGGSDYSAAILGAALPADDVWIWTDVDGVMSTDPRVVPEAHTISELSYREIAELAYFGAKVLHPKAIRPVVEAGIGLRVCNTFNASHPGTRIVAETAPNGNGKIKAVTIIRKQRLVTVEGRGMLGVPGVAARTFGAVAATGTSVPLITQASSEQSICFAVPQEAAEQVISSLEKAFGRELSGRDIDRIWATDPVDIVTVVGAGMRHTFGIAGKIFSGLGNNQVNIIAIAQGSSEVAISLVVDATEGEKAVKVIHDLI